MLDLDLAVIAPCIPNDGPSSVIATAFDLLDQVVALEPARLIDLAQATGIPHPTVHRLLRQLIEVGAVRREGTRYHLGAGLLGLGSRVTPEHRLRVVARRPMAELAAVTGAGVGLSARIGDEVVFLDTVEPRVPLAIAMPEPGSLVQPGTVLARVHAEIHRAAMFVDAGGVLPNLSCVTVTIPLRDGQVAAVTAFIAAKRPPVAMLGATRTTGARVARQLRTPSGPEMSIRGKSPLSRRGFARTVPLPHIGDVIRSE